MATTQEVFQHHLEAFAAGDVDEILKDYSDETIVVYDDRVARGLDEIRAFFEHWLDQLLPPGCRFDLDHVQIADDLVFITWTAETEKLEFELGTDTFLIRDSKVVRQSVAAKIRQK